MFETSKPGMLDAQFNCGDDGGPHVSLAMHSDNLCWLVPDEVPPGAMLAGVLALVVQPPIQLPGFGGRLASLTATEHVDAATRDLSIGAKPRQMPTALIASFPDAYAAGNNAMLAR